MWVENALGDEVAGIDNGHGKCFSVFELKGGGGLLGLQDRIMIQRIQSSGSGDVNMEASESTPISQV